MKIRSFREFWPHYVRQHTLTRTRLLHATGSSLAVILFGAAFAVDMRLLAAVPAAAYTFAWYGHRFVERNRPSLTHPFYSLAADYRMLFLMMAGRMEGEVTKYAAIRDVASGPASPADFPAA